LGTLCPRNRHKCPPGPIEIYTQRNEGSPSPITLYRYV
jgi:hypothetical protein